MRYDLTGKTVFMTGATGFIGRHVAHRLLQEQVRIRAFVRNAQRAASLASAGADIICGSLLDEDALKQAMNNCQIVLHFAGVLNEWQPWTYYHQVNVIGTQAVAQTALTVGVERFVYASTIWAYGINAGKD